MIHCSFSRCITLFMTWQMPHNVQLTEAQLEGRPGLLPYCCHVPPCQNRGLYFNTSYWQLHFTAY